MCEVLRTPNRRERRTDRIFSPDGYQGAGL